MKWLCCWVWLLGMGAARADCPLPAETANLLQAEGVQLHWRAEPASIQVGKPFSLRVTLCPEDALLRRVDASMPEHRHGMNYKPSVQALGAGLWRVEGLLWHMGGRWELRFDAEHRGRVQVLRQSMQLQ